MKPICAFNIMETSPLKSMLGRQFSTERIFAALAHV
jgi:hypothetical protein